MKQIKTIMSLLSLVSFRKHEMVSLILGNSFLFFPRLSRSLIVMMQATLKSKVSSMHLQLLEVINVLAMSAIACEPALRDTVAEGRENGRRACNNDVKC